MSSDGWLLDVDSSSSVAILISVLVVVLVLFIDFLGDARVYDTHNKLIPGPRSNWYGVNFFSVVRKARRSYQGTKAMVEVLLPKYGYDCVSSYLFGLTIVILAHPEYVKPVLSGSHNKFPKAHKYSRLKFFLGDGLVTSSGRLWQNHRAMISPSFHANALKGMITLFSQHCNNQIQKWQSLYDKDRDDNANGISIDLNLELWELTLSIICDAAFGYDVHDKDNEDNFDTMKPLFFEIIDEMNNRILDPTDWWYAVRNNNKAQVAVRKVQGLIDRIIAKRLGSIDIDDNDKGGNDIDSNNSSNNNINNNNDGDDAKLSVPPKIR